MYFKIVLLLFGFIVGKAVGLRCYACSFSTTDADQSCLTISNSTNIVDCPFTFCTIMRIEFMDPSGVIASFLRGCEEEPDHLNHEVTDPTFRTFYRACTTDLCNIGNGIQPITGGNLSPRPVYTGENLLVPGTGAATAIGTSVMTILLSAAMLLYFV